MAATTLQLNTRIDADLKRGGDAVLAHCGTNATDAIRGLWNYLVANQTVPEFLAKKGAEKNAWVDDGCGLAVRIASEQCGSGIKAAATESTPLSCSEEMDSLYDDLLDRMESRCR